jgi:hypothetical protein
MPAVIWDAFKGGIEKGRALNEVRMDFIIALIMGWVCWQMDKKGNYFKIESARKYFKVAKTEKKIINKYHKCAERCVLIIQFNLC